MTTHEDAVAMVSLLYAARADKRDAEATDKALSDGIKGYFIESGETEVYDGEAGIMASLQERQQAGSLNLVLMALDEPDLLLQLALAGALSADLKAVSVTEHAAGAARYLRAGSKTYALTVKAEK